MIALDLLWWIGWAYFAACAALPLAILPDLGRLPTVVGWALLAPWTSLAGLALLHRLLPPSEPGKFRMFSDPGSVRWALRGWAPSVYLTVFQPLFAQSPAFQRIALRAFGARLGRGTLLTSRTVVREPHHLQAGAGCVIGEFAHFVCSYQPRPGTLVVAPILLGDAVFVGAYSHLGPGASIGSRTMLEYGVKVGAHSSVGEGARIGAETTLVNSVRVGNRVRIGKRCSVPSGSVIPDDAVLPDGTRYDDGAGS